MITPNDIYINFDTILLEGDFAFDRTGQDLYTESGIQTAVVISLFTNRRAAVDDVLPDPNSTDRKGWWGDLGSSEFQGDQIGSRLWLLSREKTLESVLTRAKEYIEEALEWMVEDSIVKKIEVETERQGVPGNDRLAFGVKIYQLDDSIYTVDILNIASVVAATTGTTGDGSVLFGGQQVLFGGQEVIFGGS